MNDEELKELARQLRCPDGEVGAQLGESMGKSNDGMIQASMVLLDLGRGRHVLELGHGACTHLSALLEMGTNLSYAGLEISTVMYREAKRIAEPLSADHEVEFRVFDGVTIPFGDASFDRVLSVNTVYFWTPARAVMDEISRVLTPGGVVVVSYVDKDFMKTLPFVDAGFTLYEDSEVQTLAEGSGLRVEAFHKRNEQAVSKHGDLVDRRYTIAELRKL
ncbi:class I SAM-dependent methyltransferase [Gephyromycinifex aptenodytis]|uniref:class I SAM-dependent methyltransferase n=1 Tax=Gephyromycinifex aptenodytis TaxID=2716227 RepID=UPI0014489822|nr:class I SAM-dependent methyltransferase [Gephyromycinifex aptenodytis]